MNRIVLESLMVIPRSAQSNSGIRSVCVIEINSIWFLDRRVTGHYRTIEDPCISKNTADISYLLLHEDQSMVEGRI